MIRQPVEYWQPAQHWLDELNICSFEVWLELENGMADHPQIPEEDWQLYRDDDIEYPTFLDLDD